MDYNKLLVDLVNQCKVLIADNERYNGYMLLLDKLEKSLDDFSNISMISMEEVKLFQNANAIRYIAGIEYYSQFDEIEKSELINAIGELKKMLSFVMENDEVIKEINDKLFMYDQMEKKIINGQIDEELAFNFVYECYIKKLISADEVVGLNLYIAKECSVNSISEDFEEEVVLEENVEPILEDLRLIFKKYGYDYDNMHLNKKVRTKIEKYATVDYVDYVLSVLSFNNITVSEFEDRQSIICDIFVYKDKEALDGINQFVKDNNCTFYDLLGMGGIFHKRKRKFKFRNKINNGGSINDGEVIPGEYDSFLKNVLLYKKCNNLSDDYKLSKIDFEGRTIFFMTPHDKILENLKLLDLYGIVEKGKLPDASSALCGANVQYLLDRCVEARMFDYCKKNPYFVGMDAKEFRWYKIKRCSDLGQSLFRGKGLRKELRDDSSFDGINLVTDDDKFIIEQIPMSMSEMSNGKKHLPDYIAKKIVGESDKVMFDLLYKYRTYDVSDLFAKSDFSKARLSLIQAIISKRVNVNSDFLEEENDEFIKLLDNAILCDQDNKLYNCKLDDRTYQFVNSAYPGVRVLISRYKVLQLVNKLKEDQSWITATFSELDKENMMLSVLLKDTIISAIEMQTVRFTVRNILNNQLAKFVSERKGNGR